MSSRFYLLNRLRLDCGSLSNSALLSTVEPHTIATRYSSTTASASASIQTTIHDDGQRLEVRGCNWPHPLYLPHTWLRDHCRCPHCYSPTTLQRTFDVTSMPINIRPCAVKLLDKEILKLTWPDGHETKYSLQFLWQHNLAGAGQSALAAKDIKLPWKARTFPPLHKITVPLSSVLNSGPGLTQLVGSIEKYGLGIINEVAPDVSSTEAAVRAVAPVHRTFFGEMWSFSADLEKMDSAYSSDTLGAHTDTIYFTQGAKIQVFHCLEESLTGGETLLVDGLHVANTLKKADPEAYAFLSTQPVSGEYIGDGQHHLSIHTVFSHHPVTGALQQFRYNLYDRAPVSSLDVSGIHSYYRHLKTLAATVTNKDAQVWIKLTPGSVMFIDNWRVMHGRAGYSGRRTMAGCYIGNEDYTSCARTLGLLK